VKPGFRYGSAYPEVSQVETLCTTEVLPGQPGRSRYTADLQHISPGNRSAATYTGASDSGVVAPLNQRLPLTVALRRLVLYASVAEVTNLQRFLEERKT
jgi:hypothetical protein